MKYLNGSLNNSFPIENMFLETINFNFQKHVHFICLIYILHFVPKKSFVHLHRQCPLRLV
jgi:hypothetical protein